MGFLQLNKIGPVIALDNHSMSSFSFQPETVAYLNAIGISNDATVYFSATPQQTTGKNLWTILDNCVVSIKNAVGLTLGINNLSTKFKFIYPRIGDTSSQFRYNLVTAAADGNYFGGWIFTPAGAKPNGVNGYFDSGYNTSQTGYNDISYGVFIKESINDLFPEGAQGSGISDCIIYPRFSGQTFTRLQDATYSATVVASSIGLFLQSRIAQLEYKVYQSGSTLATYAAISDPRGSNMPLYEGACFSGGSAIQFGTALRTFSIYGSGLTPTQVVNFTNSITTFDTALNR